MFDIRRTTRLKFPLLQKYITETLGVDFSKLNPAILSEEDDAWGELRYSITVNDIPEFGKTLFIKGTAEVITIVMRKCPEDPDGYVRVVDIWSPCIPEDKYVHDWIDKENLRCLYYQLAYNKGKIDAYDVNDEQHITWRNQTFGEEHMNDIHCVLLSEFSDVTYGIRTMINEFMRTYAWVGAARETIHFDNMVEMEHVEDIEAFIEKQIDRHYKKLELQNERKMGLTL